MRVLCLISLLVLALPLPGRADENIGFNFDEVNAALCQFRPINTTENKGSIPPRIEPRLSYTHGIIALYTITTANDYCISFSNDSSELFNLRESVVQAAVDILTMSTDQGNEGDVLSLSLTGINSTLNRGNVAFTQLKPELIDTSCFGALPVKCYPFDHFRSITGNIITQNKIIN